MLKKIVLALLVLAMAVAATAGTAPSGAATYRVTLLQTSVINGSEMKPGDYKITIVADKATISNTKQTVEVGVKVQNADEKFDRTAVRYSQENGKQVVSEIRVGGTKTTLVFNR
jgi:hypothetical protein